MAKGYYLVQGDKTTCGGKIVDGASDHRLFGKGIACERDRVTCGQHPGMYMIAGGIANDSVHGRKMAGTLDSTSSCPCRARFVPSMTQDTYEKASSSSGPSGDQKGAELQQTVAHDSDNTLAGSLSAPSSRPCPPAIITFSQNFKADRGDLVYGISEERGKYICELYPGYEVYNKNLPPLVIDVYNNNVSATVLMENDVAKVSRLVNKPGKLVKKMLVPQNLDAEVRKHRDGPNYLWSEYFHVGESNPKFNIAAIYKEVARHYNKDEYHELFTGMPAVMGYVPKLLWKRGSKLGIEMTAQNSSHHLHFVLDGLSIKDIVNKTPPKGSSITASELRYAYRSRQRLTGKIHFYQGGQEVDPPWESEPGLWQSYGPSSALYTSPSVVSDLPVTPRTFGQRLQNWFKTFR